MIVACTRNGIPEEALELFHRMSRIGLQPNHFTFATVLPSCTNSASLWKGMEIHTKIIKYGFESDLVVANALIDMYAKCGSIENACELFDKMLQRYVVSWTALITVYAHNGLLDVAKSDFEKLDSSFGVFEKESLQNIMGLATKLLGPYEVMFGSPYLVFSRKTILVVLL
jgi:pentatricopeptide repeat protein